MKTIILTLALLINLNIFAQKEDLKYASLNILSNSIIGGIGSGIHKKSNQTFWQAFKQGAFKGSIGGAICYTGKKMVQQTNINYIWTSRIVHSLGTSITYNASLNKKMLQSYTLPIYFTQITYDGKLHCKIDAMITLYTLYLSLNKDMNFNFIKSLQIGNIYFNKKYNLINDSIILLNDNIEDKNYGQCGGNALYTKTQKTKITEIIYKNNHLYDIKNYLLETNKNEILKHEIIHSFQYQEFNNINNLFNSKILNNKYINLNINMIIIYQLNNLTSGYKNNILEKEADFFSEYKDIINRSKFIYTYN